MCIEFILSQINDDIDELTLGIIHLQREASKRYISDMKWKLIPASIKSPVMFKIRDCHYLN